MADVLKTNQLDFASKKHLHITIAYHDFQDFPDHIMEITKDWIGNLTIFQKTAFLRKWGGRSDVIGGPLSLEVANFRRRAGLILPNPLHIELHRDKGYGHWEN